MTISIAVDVMSGDNPMITRLNAVKIVQSKNPHLHIILVGDRAMIERELGPDSSRFEIEHSTEVVAMDDLPTRAIRRRDTSMRRCLHLVKEKRASAAISSGNTGALMGLGVLELGTIEGITRPAIASYVPTKDGNESCCFLDLGANVNCSAEMLRDFALMGSALTKATKKKDIPRVGLLNIGKENYKGSKLVRQAGEMLKENPHLNFIGNVEGADIFLGTADVIVCDGFTGNIVLKATEGVAMMIREIISETFNKNLLNRIFGFLSYPVLSQIKGRMDHRSYNGASFLGLNGVVVKSHGNADEKAFSAAILSAIKITEQNVPQIIAGIAFPPKANKD